MKWPWLEKLKQLVEKKPIVALKFDDGEWDRLRESRYGVNEFTVARSHSLLEGVKVPTPCLIFGKDENDEHLYFGLISSRSAVTTLESRIKIRRGVQILPKSKTELLRLVSKHPHSKHLKDRLCADASVVPLSEKLSSHLIERLASIELNRGAMRSVAESLSAPKYFKGTSELQEDALRMALKAFGLSTGARASALELVEGRETALARIAIMEDSVVEHDARNIPGYDLVESDMTGRAVFERGDDRLEVFTANRRPLEKVFGVDLIYLNSRRQNIVMLQYKMLELVKTDEVHEDWIYRPDAKLNAEISRMKRFAVAHPPGPYEYRFNPAVFFLKFVKRDGSISAGGIITPIDHFDQLRKDPSCRGPKKGIRVGYESLAGRYLRQAAFFDLIRSGYIGAHAETTAHLRTLVEAVLRNDRAVVAAIQFAKPIPEEVNITSFDEFNIDEELD